MSLGITLPWRARSHRIGFSGISLIPRGPRRWSRAPSAQLPHFREWVRAASEAAKPNPAEATSLRRGKEAENVSVRTSHDAVAKAAGGSSAAEAVSLPSRKRANEEERAKGDDRALETRSQKAQTSLPRETATPTSAQLTPNDVQQTVPIRKVSLDDEAVQHLRPWRSVVDASLKDLSGRQVARPKKRGKDAARPQQDSVLVPPPMKYIPPRETRTSRQRHHEGLERQLRLEAIRKIKKEPLTNWRAILDILRLRTRSLQGPWQEHGRKISISTELAETLLYDPDHTIWDIHDKTRCHIELHWPKDQSQAATPFMVYLLLSGDDEALGHAVEEVTRLASRSSSQMSIEGGIGSRLSGPEAAEATPASEEVIWYSSKESQRPSHVARYVLDRKYEEILKPKEWTAQTFEAYVAAITKATLPAHLAYKFYGSGVAAKMAALAHLHAAFEDPVASLSRSTRALKLTLKFIESHGHSYRNHARDLFNSFTGADKRALALDTSVFNILQAGNVKVKDLHNLDSILRLMIRHGCLPNVETWGLFLQMMESEQVRRHIIKIMHSHGLFIEPGSVQLVAKELIVYDVRERHDDWPGIRNFMQLQDAKYGKNWESLATMNKLMNELGRMGNLASCRDLLDIMAESASFPPLTLTINTVLLHAGSQRNLAAAIAALQRAHQCNLDLDEQSYHELFGLAFRLRKPNMMGLIWRVASLENKNSWHMRSRVSDLACLDGRPPVKKGASGTANDGEFPALPAFHQPDMLPELEKTPRGRRGPKIAAMLSERYRDWRPAAPLHKLLASAWEADNEIHRTVKEAKQEQKQRQQRQPDEQPEPASTSDAADNPSPPPPPMTTAPVSTTPRKATVPGIPLVLRRKVWRSEDERRERVRLDMTVTHLVPAGYQPPALVESEPAHQIASPCTGKET